MNLHTLIAAEDEALLEGRWPPVSSLSVLYEGSFFGDCDRDEAGHCKPGSGGGDKPSADDAPGEDDEPEDDTDADEPLSDEEKEEARQAWKDHEEEHAKWEKETGKLQSEYDEAHAAWETETDRLVDEYNEAQAAWEKRGEERTERRDLIEEDHVEAASNTIGALPSVPLASHSGEEGYAERVKAHADAWRAGWEKAFGKDGELSKRLESIGASSGEKEKVASVAERGAAAVDKAAAKYEAAVEKHDKAAKAWEEHRDSMPAEPEEPEEPQEYDEEPQREDYDTDEEHAAAREEWQGEHEKFEKEHAAWEKASKQYEKDQVAWEKASEKLEALEEKEGELAGVVSDTADEIDTVFTEHHEKLAEAVGKIQSRLVKEIDKEEAADESPDEPDYPDEPDEPEYDDEPDPPDLPHPDEFTEGVVPNKSGPRCHDDKSGAPAPCPHQEKDQQKKAAKKQLDTASKAHGKAAAKLEKAQDTLAAAKAKARDNPSRANREKLAAARQKAGAAAKEARAAERAKAAATKGHARAEKEHSKALTGHQKQQAKKSAGASKARKPATAKSGAAAPKKILRPEDHPVLKAHGEQLHVLDVEHPEVQRHLDHLSRLPQGFAEEMVKAGVEVYFGDGKVPDLDDNGHLKNVQPRGWEPGKTWNDAAGAYSRATKQACAGTGEHGSRSVALHEYGHAVGDLFGYDHDPRLMAAHKRLHAKLPPYLQQGGPGGLAGRQELMAEGFAHVIMDREDAAKKYDPEFVSFIDDVLKHKHKPDDEWSNIIG